MSDVTPTERSLTAHIEADLMGQPEILLAVAIADNYERADENLTVTVNDLECEVVEILGQHGSRFHLARAAEPGRLTIDYSVSTHGTVDQAAAHDMEWFHYLRPSRYCESDRIGPTGKSEFQGLAGFDLVNAVRNWVNENINYVLGSSRPTDGAAVTLLERQGVCRDFAHLTVALLRANDVAARVVSVYAPGLEPADFHAVVEVCLDGLWYLVDSTGLAPRSSMVRIVTGADAAESAFLTTVGGTLNITSMDVVAVVAPELPNDSGAPTYLW